MTCNHPFGDAINGYWVCAHCYSKLPERPYRLVMEAGVPHIDGRIIPRRQIMVFAPIAQDGDGLTLGQFVGVMALRLIARTRGGFQKGDALDYAVEILRTFGEPFGNPDVDWSEAGAFDLVDEDMTCWDADEVASNG